MTGIWVCSACGKTVVDWRRLELIAEPVGIFQRREQGQAQFDVAGDRELAAGPAVDGALLDAQGPRQQTLTQAEVLDGGAEFVGGHGSVRGIIPPSRIKASCGMLSHSEAWRSCMRI